MSDESLPLRPGEYVTVILALPNDKRWRSLAIAPVITSSMDGFTIPYGSVHADIERNFYLKDEGTLWLRGQFTFDSHEVAAAIVAKALTTEKSKK